LGSHFNLLMNMKRLIAIALCALLLPLSAHAWWNEAWTIRKKITLDTQSIGLASEVQGAPVLIRLSTGNFDFLSAGENGVDIRFVAEDDKTELPFQIERFDVLNELGFVWVRVPTISNGSGAQHIWLYYGNDQAVAASAAPVYDATQLATWHLSDSTGLPQDASPAGNPASAGTVTFSTSGLIAGAARLQADGAGLELNSASLQSASAFTFSAWFKPDAADGELLRYGDLTLALQVGIPSLEVAGARAQATGASTLGGWHQSGGRICASGYLACGRRPDG
jgi:biopolymer transport protein ExbB